MRWNWNHSLPDAAAGHDPLDSLLLALHLRGLPPALIIAAECDPLCSEAEAYAQRLADAGVPACRRNASATTACCTRSSRWGQVFDDGRAAVACAGEALRRALA